MNFVEGTNWYAIQTKTKQEDLVAYSLANVRLEILNPKQTRIKTVCGYRRTVVAPLFPGYLFARFDPARFLHMIQYTRGVKKVLHFGESLLRVEDEIIRGIRKRLNTDGYVEMDGPTLLSGSPVSVEGGLFDGFRGIFKREMNDRKRVVLLLDILGSSAEVVIDKQFLSFAV